MKTQRKNNDRLKMWQDRLARNQSAYSAELAQMDAREELYAGRDTINPIVSGARKKKTPHVRNICAEMIESQVNSDIPQPKVTPCRPQDEGKAKLIEDMLRNELDRLPFEQLNDMMERTVPIQGGGAFLIEWDNTKRTPATVGELAVSVLHPKQIVPQDGVYTGIEDMDYIILKIPQTKEYIRQRYGVDVEDETEQEPEIKSADGASTSDDLITQYIAYYKNGNGGVGLYSWVDDTEIENIDDYQARRLSRCKGCGEVEPTGDGPDDTLVEQVAGAVSINGEMLPVLADGETAETAKPKRDGKKRCPKCGGTEFASGAEEYEEVYLPIRRSDGSVIPGAQKLAKRSETMLDEFGMPAMEIVQTPTRIPYYKPDIYPVLLQKNVSVYGRFLGDSDIDKIADQQNTTNRIEAKIIDKLCKSGSYMTLPDDASIKVDEDDMKVIRPGNAAAKQLIDVYDLQGNVEQDMAYLYQVYEEARQIIGITDSFQGRVDKTATSGKAKEFAAAQSAGRLESKRVMKQAAYAALFEAMFKFKLAYADEPRPVSSSDIHGNTQFAIFNRYDFLEQDAAGDWHWNDRFLFSCDTSAPLASNREAMWQETRMNLQTGAFGDPANLQTLILFWTKMEMLHYPGAGETRAYLEEQLQQQIEQQRAQQQMQQMMLQQQAAAQSGGNNTAQLEAAVVRKAQEDAKKTALQRRQQKANNS